MRETKFRQFTKRLGMEYFDLDDIGVAEGMVDPVGDIMQYTGLKDVNGVEIYEGDIVQDYTLRPMIVSFSYDNYAEILGWKLLLIDGEPAEYYYGVSPDQTFKVIGNIYENPELIK